MDDLPTVHIYTDGSVNKNPGGTGGYAAVLIFKTQTKTIIKEVAGGDFSTTNNRMEMMGAIIGLETLKRPARVVLMSDSQYVVKGMKQYVPGWLSRGGGLEGRPNADLWRRMLKAAERHEVKWKWVPSHTDVKSKNKPDRKVIVWNVHADKLAGETMRKTLETGFAQTHERMLVREDNLGDSNENHEPQAGASISEEQVSS